MTVAVSAASGQLGHLVIAALKARHPASDIIALARNTSMAEGQGVEVRAFDYYSPDVAALKGITTLALISSGSMEDRALQHRNAIDAATAAGVKHLIYTSLLFKDAAPILLAADHLATEAYLQSSGLVSTILRNGWYTEYFVSPLRGDLSTGVMIGSAGDGRFSSAARADYAEAIAVVALDPGLAGKSYNLGGDEAHSLADVAAEVSRVTGMAVSYRNMSPSAYARNLQALGLPEDFANLVTDSDIQAAKGALFDDSKTLSRLLGRPTTPWQQIVAAELGV